MVMPLSFKFRKCRTNVYNVNTYPGIWRYVVIVGWSVKVCEGWGEGPAVQQTVGSVQGRCIRLQPLPLSHHTPTCTHNTGGKLQSWLYDYNGEKTHRIFYQ